MVTVTNPPNVNLSQVIIDADLAMGAHNITLGAAQTVDGKDVSTLMNIIAECNLEMGGYDIKKNRVLIADGNVYVGVWDISTAAFLQLFSVAVEEAEPKEVFFNPAGTKMYVIGTVGDDVNEYDLGTAWDVSTAVWLQLFSVAGQEVSPQGLFFNSYGTKMYVLGTAGDDVNEYDLGTPWDVSTAVWLQLFSVAGEELTPIALFFNPDGTKMYVMGTTGDDVNEYDLGTAWDVSTAVWLQLFSVAGQDLNPRGLFFNPDGTKMYLVGDDGDDVNEYDVSTILT